jgi:carbonic anhydrase
MELHLVHQSAAGELLVVGQILHLGGTNANLAPIFSNLPQNPGEHFSVSSFNLAALLPSSLTTFRYDGSLTTAPYSEGVKWNMLTTAATLSQAQIDAFRLLFPDGDSREEQSLDGRVIRTDLQGFVPEPGAALLVLWGAIPLLITNRFRKTKATV